MHNIYSVWSNNSVSVSQFANNIQGKFQPFGVKLNQTSVSCVCVRVCEGKPVHMLSIFQL